MKDDGRVYDYNRVTKDDWLKSESSFVRANEASGRPSSLVAKRLDITI